MSINLKSKLSILILSVLSCRLIGEEKAHGTGLHMEPGSSENDELKELYARKIISRTLYVYNSYFFRIFKKSGYFNEPLDCPIGEENSFTCYAYQKLSSTGLKWLDVGAGFAIAQREFAQRIAKNNLNQESYHLSLTALDLFDWEKVESGQFLAALKSKELYADLFNDEFRPEIVLKDVMKYVPKNPYNLITAVEVFQYLPDKLMFLTHLYNMLSVGGALLLYTDGPSLLSFISPNEAFYLEDNEPLQIEVANFFASHPEDFDVVIGRYSFPAIAMEEDLD